MKDSRSWKSCLCPGRQWRLASGIVSLEQGLHLVMDLQCRLLKLCQVEILSETTKKIAIRTIWLAAGAAGYVMWIHMCVCVCVWIQTFIHVANPDSWIYGSDFIIMNSWYEFSWIHSSRGDSALALFGVLSSRTNICSLSCTGDFCIRYYCCCSLHTMRNKQCQVVRN